VEDQHLRKKQKHGVISSFPCMQKCFLQHISPESNVSSLPDFWKQEKAGYQQQFAHASSSGG
jgi:hypothetical protein